MGWVREDVKEDAKGSESARGERVQRRGKVHESRGEYG